jgi:hypothetical protein
MCLVPTVLMFKVKETASEMIRSEADWWTSPCPGEFILWKKSGCFHQKAVMAFVPPYIHPSPAWLWKEDTLIGRDGCQKTVNKILYLNDDHRFHDWNPNHKLSISKRQILWGQENFNHSILELKEASQSPGPHVLFTMRKMSERVYVNEPYLFTEWFSHTNRMLSNTWLPWKTDSPQHDVSEFFFFNAMMLAWESLSLSLSLSLSHTHTHTHTHTHSHQTDHRLPVTSRMNQTL